MDKATTILLEASNFLLPLLKDYNFFPNRKLDTYSKKDGDFIFNFNIQISGGKNSDNISHHLTLNIEHTGTNHIFKNIVKTMNGNEKRSWLSNKNPICSLTDWKVLYMAKENSNDNIWLTNLSSLSEIVDWQDKYKCAVELALEWFNIHKNVDAILEWNWQSGFTYDIEINLALVKYFENQNLSNYYKKILPEMEARKNLDRKEIEVFYSQLIN